MPLGEVASKHSGFLFCRKVQGIKGQVFVHSGALPPDQKLYDIPVGASLELDDIEFVKRGPRANKARLAQNLSDIELAEQKAQTDQRTTDLLGWVTRLNHDRGFGFINSEQTSKTIYFNAADVNGRFNDLTEGVWVYFDLTDSPRGPRACNVQVCPTS
jgi:cold shock CspA family protein